MFYYESKNEIKQFFFFLGGGAGIDGWTDEQAQTNLPVTGEGARVSDFFSQRIGGKGAGEGG